MVRCVQAAFGVLYILGAFKENIALYCRDELEVCFLLSRLQMAEAEVDVVVDCVLVDSGVKPGPAICSFSDALCAKLW